MFQYSVALAITKYAHFSPDTMRYHKLKYFGTHYMTIQDYSAGMEFTLNAEDPIPDLVTSMTSSRQSELKGSAMTPSLPVVSQLSSAI